MLKWIAALMLVASAAQAEMAPTFTLAGRDGEVKLEDYRGKLVLVDFWASWCGPCRQSFPWMNDMLAKYQGQGLSIVAINLDQSREDAMTFLAKNAASFDIAFDGEGKTPEAYQVNGMPNSFLVDAKGELLSRHVGFHTTRTQEYENQIRAALGLSPLGQ